MRVTVSPVMIPNILSNGLLKLFFMCIFPCKRISKVSVMLLIQVNDQKLLLHKYVKGMGFKIANCWLDPDLINVNGKFVLCVKEVE